MSKEIKCPKCGEVFKIDESSYSDLLSQIKESEIEKRVKNNLQSLKKDWEIKQKEKDAEYEKLKYENNSLKKEYELEKQQALNKLKDDNKDLKNQIVLLQNQLKSDKKTYENDLNNTKRDYEDKLIREREYRTKLNIKLVGESLEQHCLNEFNRLKPLAFPNAQFNKDNTISNESKSKGDFIFRDFENNQEYISIMFEMKNEQSHSATKHKNIDFLKELDKDRKEKKCEYAVLVTMLEIDNDFYNNGIVDASFANPNYKKMYIIRPNAFISLITILISAAKNSINYQKQLLALKNEKIDVSCFEDKLKKFQDDVDKNWKRAGNFYSKTINEIDKTIEHLEKMKDNFQSCLRQLEIANNKCQDLSIRKLTHNNPTMKNLFEKQSKK